MGIDRWAEEPYYLQLARLIRAQIESGELEPGQPLASEARYMQEQGLARNTVRQALAVLRESGHIETHKRRGSRVLAREHWQQS